MNSSLQLIEKAERLEAFARAEAEELMEELLSGHLHTADIARLLLALNRRPVNATELGSICPRNAPACRAGLRIRG